MKIITPFSSLLCVCLFGFLISACDTQAPDLSATNTTKDKPLPAVTKPPLDLTLDNIKQPDIYEGFLNTKNDEANNSALFNTLTKKQHQENISVSGQLLTDEAIINDYLKSVNGAAVTVKGRFK